MFQWINWSTSTHESYGASRAAASVSHLRVIRVREGADALEVTDGAFRPCDELEEFGVEDPRITPIDGRFYITYVAVSRHGPATALASTTDFRTFERHCIVFCPENKDVVLFPERIEGAFVALHRPVCGSPLLKSPTHPTQAEFYSYLESNCERFDRADSLPHVPPIPGVLYTRPTPNPDGKYTALAGAAGSVRCRVECVEVARRGEDQGVGGQSCSAVGGSRTRQQPWQRVRRNQSIRGEVAASISRDRISLSGLGHES